MSDEVLILIGLLMGLSALWRILNLELWQHALLWLVLAVGLAVKMGLVPEEQEVLVGGSLITLLLWYTTWRLATGRSVGRFGEHLREVRRSLKVVGVGLLVALTAVMIDGWLDLLVRKKN